MNKIKCTFSSLVLSLALANVAVTHEIQQTTDTATLEQRLEHLIAKLEAKRVEHHIPGMSLAVVLDGQTILVHSFGHSNLEKQLPVTDNTLFPIGSVTKSFTAAVIGTLVDDKAMRWDAPITDYIPYFELPIELGDEASEEETEVLIKDLLSHQTGFTRMQFLGMNNTLSPEETLRAAVLAEPMAPFRSEFLYTNVQYLAAGVAAGVVDDSDWHTVVEKQLLAPIGMNNTFTSWHRAPEHQPLVTGYFWDDDKKEYKAYPLRTIDNIAPAGAIVSTASDMAKWIRFHLGRGEIDGQRVLSEEQHAQLWEPQIEIAPGIDYGFGWMLHSVNGMSVVEHGGSVRGGCAEFAMFPNEKLGFVLLMNVSATPLIQESITIVQDAMLGNISTRNGDELDLTPYIGTYIANFATFKNAHFTVSNKDGILAIDVPSQMLYELKPPAEDGKWYFALTDQVAISFERDGDDNVVGLQMHQGGMTFELPREGVEIAGEISLSELQRYLGTYHSEELDTTTTVVIQNNRLAVDVPNQMVFELYPPDDEDVWVARVIDKLRVRFVKDEQQHISGFEFLEDESIVSFARIEVSTKDTMQTVESILTKFNLGERGKALASIGSVKFEGVTNMLQSGISGKSIVIVDPAGRILSETDCGKFGWFRFGMIGDEGVIDLSFVESEELKPEQLEHFQSNSPLAWSGNWPEDFESVTLLKEKTEDNRTVWIFQITNGDDPSKTIAVDQITGDVVFVKSMQPIPELGISLPYTFSFENFTEVGGIRIPLTYKETNEMTGVSETVFESVETGVDAPDELFRLTPREQPSPWIATPKSE